MPTIEELSQAGNHLALQALFYSDGIKTHLDLGSNDGRTLRGLDPGSLTCVEAYEPSVESLRAMGVREAVASDLRPWMRMAVEQGKHYDRVTMFDVIEHLPREAAEKVIDQIEQVATREIVFFVPVETPEMHEDPAFAAYREWGLSQHPEGQQELQRHLSFWSPEDFAKRGYLVLELVNFHGPVDGPQWPAFFAAKYASEEDERAAVARIQAWLEQPAPELPEAHVSEPSYVAGKRHMQLGRGVVVGPYSRIECVAEYYSHHYTPQLTIGEGTTIEWFAHIGCAGKVTIGRDCIIAGRVTIMDHEHGYDATRPLHGQGLRVGEVEVGDSCFIGENVTILPGAHIGDHSVIGAGAVVKGFIPAYSVAVGAPARVVRSVRPGQGLTSIIIPTYNGRDLLESCLQAIEANTPEPHEVIIVDNGSTDSTAEFLGMWANDYPLQVACLSHNLGFPAGVNRGLALAKGDQICLLNNDTEVTPGWLGEMLGVLREYPDCGLVGPMSDNVSGSQCGPRGRGSVPVQRLVGFCLLVRRAVVEKLGGLDERYGLGNFDDDDYCLRALIAGFTLRIARGSFVHHRGFQTWDRVGNTLEDQLAVNRRLFLEKWCQGDETNPIDTSAAAYIALPELVTCP
jgi:GT2 family glycosyltransferase/acetyltransferase-like isoleucine patch superfamily enzyme